MQNKNFFQTFLVVLGFVVISPFSFSQQLNYQWIGENNEKNSKKNQTFEIGFQLTPGIQKKINQFFGNQPDGLNPYDPEQIDFSVTITSPSGKNHQRFGFYYQDFTEDFANNKYQPKQTPFPWRLRFAPDEIGTWEIKAVVTSANSTDKMNFDLKFNCIQSEFQGPIEASKTGTNADRFLKYSQTGKDFHLNGMNISKFAYFTYGPVDCKNHVGNLEKLAAEKGNFARFEMGASNGLPDWDNMRNYTGKQDEMFAYDKLIKTAEDLGVYYIVFRHHVELIGAGWDLANWQNNPYKKALDLKKISDYYKNPEAIKWQKNNLRYMYSRWGGSPKWSFYGYSEIEKFYEIIMKEEGISEQEGIDLVLNWYLDQKKYIHENLKPTELFANSYGRLSKKEKNGNFNGFAKNSDIVALHAYSTIKKANYERRYNEVELFWNEYKKPIIVEEMGINDDKLPIYCCTGLEFHNSIWSTAFMGSPGTGMDWWHDRGIMDNDYHKDFLPIAEFFETEDKIQNNYSPQKWTDGNDKSRLLESFQLVSKNKQRAIGWLHNATYYWRNDVGNKCLQSLIDSSNLETPCVVGDNVKMGRRENKTDYATDYHMDNYTKKGGFQPINSGANIQNNPTFKIENLLGGLGKNKAWYKIEFFSTRPNDHLKILEEATQVVSADMFKNLKIHCPNLDNNHPDVAFRLTYLGKAKKMQK